jgi:NADH-quinone oxidoreductase subunit M
LIRKMPYTFLSALIAVMALAGIPPVSGFVGKWMLYEAFINSGHVWVVILLFLASTAAFLYSYRILSGLFLGQEEEEFKDVKEAPVLMTLPMLLLALFLTVAGTLPGFVFKPIAQSMESLGFSNVTYQMSILTNGWGDSVVLPYVSGVFVITFLVFLIVITWVNYKKTHYASTKDIHTAGEPPSEEDNYHFTLDFYKPFERAVAPVFKVSMTKIYNVIGRGIEDFFQYARRLYTGNAQTYALYVIIFFAILLLLAKQIS